jgi:hypothetical protein
MLERCNHNGTSGTSPAPVLLHAPARLEPSTNHQPSALDVFVVHRAIHLTATANVCVFMVLLLNVLLLWMLLLLLMPALLMLLLRDSMAGVECCQHAVLRGSGKLLVYWLRVCSLHLADHCSLGVSSLQRGRAGSAVLSRAAAA